MNNKIQIKFLLILSLFFSFTNFIYSKEYKLYFLGGQSNMDGYGLVNELPAGLQNGVKGVMIFHGNPAPDGVEIDGRGNWEDLLPGHGADFSSDGINNIYSKRFGIELTFAQSLLKLFPEENIALIKYSRGGTSIDQDAADDFGCWEPDFKKGNGVNQYDHFLATIRNALSKKDIDGDGEEDILIPAGIIWMQGESDGYFTEEIAERYESNLKKLIELMRAEFNNDKLPVVIGKITDSGEDVDGKVWDFGEIIRTAQESFVNHDVNAALVISTDLYEYSDTWHYDSEAYIDLGQKFAEAINWLNQN